MDLGFSAGEHVECVLKSPPGDPRAYIAVSYTHLDVYKRQTWNGQSYTFAMNGQTGKFVGDLPVDKAAAARWTFLLAAIYSVAAYGVAWLLHLIGLI